MDPTGGCEDALATTIDTSTDRPGKHEELRIQEYGTNTRRTTGYVGEFANPALVLGALVGRAERVSG